MRGSEKVPAGTPVFGCMRIRNGLLATALAAAVLPASALAAPDHASELSADKTSFAWTGEGSGIPIDTVGAIDIVAGETGQANPFGCDTANHDCDYVLLDVKHPGVLKINAAADGAQGVDAGVYAVHAPDIDLSLYKAAADGTPEGDSLSGSDCATGAIAETCEVKDLAAGTYVVEVSYFLADGATYKADVKLETLVPPAATAPEVPAETPATPAAPAEPAQPAQPAQPAPKKKASKKASCQKKAKKIKNKGKRKKALKKCSKLK